MNLKRYIQLVALLALPMLILIVDSLEGQYIGRKRPWTGQQTADSLAKKADTTVTNQLQAAVDSTQDTLDVMYGDIDNLETAADSINQNVSDNVTALDGKSPTAGNAGLNTTGTVTTGTWGANVGEMVLINALASDHTASGKVTSVTVDVNAEGIGAPLTMKADGNYDTADADAAATMVCQVLALETGTGTKKVLHRGYMRDDTWNWTSLGQPIYVSTTVGTLTQTAPAGSGDQVQFLGYAVTADIMFFDPCPIAIER